MSGKAAAYVTGGASLAVLCILFWLMFYQNLADNFGLRGPVAAATTVAMTTSAEGDSGNTVDRTIKICMLLISGGVIASRWQLTKSVIKTFNVGAAAFLILALSSVAWSIEPSSTLLRFITLASIVLVCFAIALAGWHPRRFQQVALPALMFILVTSLLLGIVYPTEMAELGDDLSLKNAWHGITLTKNQFGMAASLGVIICANGWLAPGRRSPWHLAGGAAAFACLVLSRSNTSLFAAMLAVSTMVLVMRVPVIRQRYSTPVVVAITGIPLLYQMVIQNVIPGAYTLLAPVRALTGKDATFSARTVIWDIVKEHIRGAPYLGTGYGAYWIGPVPNSPSYVFVYRMFFYPTEAHNGYLDVVNDLGYVGLLCLLIFLVVYVRQVLELMRSDRAQASLYLAVLIQQMVMNMSESEWFARDNVFMIVILGMCCMSRGLRESRVHAQPASR